MSKIDKIISFFVKLHDEYRGSLAVSTKDAVGLWNKVIPEVQQEIVIYPGK